MNCIILAAGKNTRLDNGIPKSMLKVGGETLLERHLRQFSQFGVERFCIVTGYRNEMLNAFIDILGDDIRAKITIKHNPDFDLANGVSLNKAGTWVKENEIEEFVFTMADHYFSLQFVKEALCAERPKTILSLVVDPPSIKNEHIDLDDVTFVKAENGLIAEIGKGIEEYNYFDTGFFKANSIMFDRLDQSIAAGNDSISNMVQGLMADEEASIIEVAGHFWNDVDTPEDLEFMRSKIN